MLHVRSKAARSPRTVRRACCAALLLVAAVAVAPTAHAARDLASQAACLAKAARKQGGGEAGRAEALRAHFECFPDDAPRFSRLFEGAGPLAGDPETHFTLFFAARNLVNDREWSAKAVGVIAGAEWSPGTIERYALLLRLAISSRPSGPLDAAGRLDDAELWSFWRVLFGSREGFAPDPAVCKNRGELRACQALFALR
jgi:hypothetical protein